MTGIRELGEFGFLRRLRQRAIVRAAGGRPTGGRAADPPGVVVGMGDDAAVLELPVPPGAGGGLQLLATGDMMVEGSHFLLSVISPRQLGHKVLAVNLSDLAAMGGKPLAALLSLGLKGDETTDFLDEFYEGLWQVGERYGCPLVGGDTISSPRAMIVDVAALGTVPAGRAVLRSGARPGDLVLVTGHLGASAAGLHLGLHPGVVVADADRAEVVRAHLEPLPRLEESQAIAAAGPAHAMMDISDGLANEVNHICEFSGVGARLRGERIPMGEATRRVAAAAGVDPLAWALYGGEDYELVFTVDPRAAEAVARAVADATGTLVTAVGEVVPASQGIWLERSGPGGAPEKAPLEARAWDHFSS